MEILSMPSQKKTVLLLQLLFAIIIILLVQHADTLTANQNVPSNNRAWSVDCVDCPNRFERLNDKALQLDSAGNPHVVFGEDQLDYAYFDGVTWQIERVDNTPRVGFNASLVLDNTGNPHIVYSNIDITGNRVVKYTYKQNGIWLSEVVDSGQITSLYLGFALDNDGNPHIAYWRYFDDILRYTYHDGDSWLTNDITDYESISTLDLDVDSTNRPHLVVDGTMPEGLYHLVLNGDVWDTEVFEMAPTASSTFHIADDDTLHVAYITDNERIVYATNPNNLWEYDEVDTDVAVERDVTLAIDAGNMPHLSYIDESDNTVKYAYKLADEWNEVTVDSLETFLTTGYPSIVVDVSGVAYIAYLTIDNSLSIAMGTNGDWENELIYLGDQTGLHLSLQHDNAGKAHISYSNSDSVRYAYQAGEEWQTETVVSGLDSIWGTALQLDSDDNPHIIYIEVIEGFMIPDALQHAYWDGFAWQVETILVDNANYSIRDFIIDDEGTLHIIYQMDGVQYAFNDGGGWQFESVANGGGESMMILSNGQPQIGYTVYDASSGDSFYLATRTTAGWMSELLVDPDRFLYGISFAWDSEESVHIVAGVYGSPDTYYYYYEDGGIWQQELITTVQDLEGEVELTFDEADNPHVAFVTPNDQMISYAVQEDVSWVVSPVFFIGSLNTTPSYLDISISPVNGESTIAFHHKGLADMMVAQLGDYLLYLPVIQGTP